MAGIGIVGAGVAGLHLGLFLQRHGLPCTIYSDRGPEQMLAGRPMNTAAHWGNTRARERALEVNHWDAPDFAVFCFYVYLGDQLQVMIRGDQAQPGICVDHRVYCATLLRDFAARGGQVEVAALQASDLERLSERHDLVVVSSGRGSLTELFPRVPEASPFTRPQRLLCTGFYRGIAFRDPVGVTAHLSPGNGEIFEMPFSETAAGGRATTLFFEIVPGSRWQVLMDLRYEDDPRRFEETVLGILREQFPRTYERVDAGAFGLTRPNDLLQGAITPTVRRGYARLDNGRYVVACGDVHIVNDPVMGQGANVASHSAFVLGQEILSDVAYDERFCQRVERRIWEFAESATLWNNHMLQVPPPQNVLQYLMAAAQHKAVADWFADSFATPERSWYVLASPERTEAFLRKMAPAAAPAQAVR